MNKALYRVLIKAVPVPKLQFTAWTGFTPDAARTERLLSVLRRERVQGGVIALTNRDRQHTSAAFGCDRMHNRTPAEAGHYFRCASISKFVTAAGVLRLAAAGIIDLDRDIGEYLRFPVRHPSAAERPITLRQLLAHRAGIRDGAGYQGALTHAVPLEKLLKQQDNFTEHLPGDAFEYTNFGAGLIGSVLEAALDKPFETVMRESILDPAGVQATYLPQRVPGLLADAWRLMPPARTPNYNSEERIARPLPQPETEPQRDYLTAHGGLCATAEELLRIAELTQSDPACQGMRIPLSDFEERDPHLREGLGCFIYQDPALPFPLYGHQGLAYGAVHGLFFRDDPAADGITGFALLTSSASEQRKGVITALNRDVARAVLG